MPATQDVVVRARVNRKLKQESDVILNKLGLTTTEAIRVFFSQVRLRKALPFDVSIPSKDNADILLPAAKRQATLDSFYED